MARSSRGAPARSAPTRTAAPAKNPAPAPRAQPQHQQNARSGVPAQQQQHHQSQVPAAVPQSSGPGIFGQIAANAASMAVGSTVARGVSHAMGWNGSAAAPAPAPEDPQTVNPPTMNGYDTANYQQQSSSGFVQDQPQGQQQCQLFAKDFANCLTATNGDAAPCNYFLEQFRACQAAHGQ